MLDLIRPFIVTLIQPSSFLAVLVLISLVMLWAGKWRGARKVLTWTVGLYLLLGLSSLPAYLVHMLEDRFPMMQAVPADVAGLIVLGGTSDVTLTVARIQGQMNASAERLVAFADLAKRFPDVPLIFTGGGPELNGMREADVARGTLSIMGLEGDRVLWERTSMNTVENASHSLALVGQDAAGRGPWLLITSARHMPRAMGTFRQAGWDVLAYPVDYTTAGPVSWYDFGSLPKISGYGEALHEWLGLMAYRLKGHTAEFFPAP